MNIQGIKQLLPFLLKNNIVPFFWGSQGIGKTQTVKQYCKENDLDVRVLMCATQEVGDLIGLLVKDDNGGVYHARPNWFPTEGKGIIFLDELNRAPNDVLQAMFQFILEGRLHTHVLPTGWKIVAAGNYNSDRFTTTDTSDAAWMSRFCHIDFTPTIEEFITYAESRGMDDVAGFIREQPNMLELAKKDGGSLDTSFIVPDRRAFIEGIGKLELETDFPEELKYEVYSGLIGTASAAAFLTWKSNQEKALTLNDILKGYKKTARNKIQKMLKENSENVRFDLLNQPIDELLTKLDANPNLLTAANYLDNLKLYLLDIPRELSMKAFVAFGKKKNFFGRNEMLNDPEYVNKFI